MNTRDLKKNLFGFNDFDLKNSCLFCNTETGTSGHQIPQFMRQILFGPPGGFENKSVPCLYKWSSEMWRVDMVSNLYWK